MPTPISASHRPAFSVAMALVAKAAEMRQVNVHRVAKANDRYNPISHTRFGVIWVMRTMGMTYPRIRDALQFKDHTSVIHAFRRAEELRSTDPSYRLFTDNLYVWALMQEPLAKVA